MYVLPLQSRFYNEEELDIFETEIASFCSQYDIVNISGDLKTFNLDEFTENVDI